MVTVFDGYALARQGRAGTALGIAAIGSFIGGTVVHHRADLRRAGRGRLRARLRAARVRRAGPAGHPAGLHHQQRRHGQGADRRARRAAAGHRRAGRLHRRRAVHLRQPGAGRRHRLRADRHGPVRARRDPLQPRGAPPARCRRRAKVAERLAVAQGPQGSPRARSAAARCSASCSASCPAAARRSPRWPPTPLEKQRAKHAGAVRQGRDRGRGRRRRRPTTPPPPRRSSRCSRWASRPTPPWRSSSARCSSRASRPARSWSTEDPELFWGVVNSMYIGNILLLIMSIPLVGAVRADPAGARRDPGADHRADHADRRLHHQQQRVRHRAW